MAVGHTTQECQIGDALDLLRAMPAESVDTVVTSPPYWGLRDYGVDGQIGMEPTLAEYHDRLLAVTAELKRVMKPTAVLFWNHGDSYGRSQGRGAGKGNEHGQMVPQKNTAAKCLTMQNERLIMRMIDEQGFILRSRIIWSKPNGMPSSVRDRFANRYEPVYMLVKQKKYWFDLDAVRVPHKDATDVRYRMQLRKNKRYGVKAPCKSNTPYQHNAARITSQESSNRIRNDNDALERLISAGKNPGDVWTIPTKPFSGSHFATFPPALIEPMIRAACPAEICSVCGVARERVTEREVEMTSGSGKAGNQPKGKHEGSAQAESGTYDIRMGPKVSYLTTGWTSCSCGRDWIAGTVLDPFCGSGTVLEVCRLLARNAIGFELNPEYGSMIRERSMAHTPPLTAYDMDLEV